MEYIDTNNVVDLAIHTHPADIENVVEAAAPDRHFWAQLQPCQTGKAIVLLSGTLTSPAVALHVEHINGVTQRRWAIADEPGKFFDRQIEWMHFRPDAPDRQGLRPKAEQFDALSQLLRRPPIVQKDVQKPFLYSRPLKR